MKPSLLAWSLLSLLPLPALAATSDNSFRDLESRDGHRLVKRADTSGNADSGLSSTTFNGVEVPPMKVLTQENFEESVKDGYWLVSNALVGKFWL